MHWPCDRIRMSFACITTYEKRAVASSPTARPRDANRLIPNTRVNSETVKRESSE